MGFISTLLVYRFVEKEEWKTSAFAGLFVFLSTLIFGTISTMLGLFNKEYIITNFSSFSAFMLISIAISVLAAGLVTNGQFKFLSKYKTKNPWKTAVLIVAVDYVISFVLIGILATLIITMFGISASNAALLI